jgi:hypothetical protein
MPATVVDAETFGVHGPLPTERTERLQEMLAEALDWRLRALPPVATAPILDTLTHAGGLQLSPPAIRCAWHTPSTGVNIR